MEKRRPPEEQSEYWEDRWRNAIDRCLCYVSNQMMPMDTNVSVASITTVCALGYLKFRLPDIAWQERFPEISNWYEHMMKYPCLKDTDPNSL